MRLVSGAFTSSNPNRPACESCQSRLFVFTGLIPEVLKGRNEYSLNLDTAELPEFYADSICNACAHINNFIVRLNKTSSISELDWVRKF